MQAHKSEKLLCAFLKADTGKGFTSRRMNQTEQNSLYEGLDAMSTTELLEGINTEDRKVPEVLPKEEETVIETAVMPDSFKGKIEDEYGVPQEVMDVVISYMDVYYKSLFTLEDASFDDLFDNELMKEISEKAVSLIINTRKNYDFDFTMTKAHYDLKVVNYKQEGDTYIVDLLEDDTMNFSFLPGIDSLTFDVENSFKITKKDGVCKISDLEKIQGYYMTFYDEAQSIEDVARIYDYYRKQLRDMHAYNEEVLKVKAGKQPYLSSKT